MSAVRGRSTEYVVKDGTTHRFVADELGSVQLVVDSVIGAVAQERYDA